MTQVLLIIAIVLTLLKYLIYADIILSWISLLGVRVRPQFIAGIIDPMYDAVKKRITTTFGPLDLTPIIILFGIIIIMSFIFGLDQEVQLQIQRLPLY